MPTARQSVRHRRRLRATLGSTPVFTADVGPGGFSAELIRVQPPGTPVQGSIRVNGDDLAFRGEIAWAKAGEPRLGLRGRIGVRFSMPSLDSRAIMVALALAGMA
jgi:hypothetical protein